MNVQEYISSGAIETCVMGLADEMEWLELEQMSTLYPEVEAYKKEFETQQEQMHLTAALTPPPTLKQRIFEALPFEKNNTTVETPVIPMMEKGSDSKPQVVPMVPTPKPMKWLQRAIAACIILLMGSIILNFYFYSQSVCYKKEYTALLVQQNSILTKNKAMEASFNTLKSPDFKQVLMAATPNNPGAMATVYWDTRSKDVYLLVNKLPKASPEKQYQLWAIVDGKPVDAGMLEEEDDSAGNILHKMHNIPQAQAFAITLEKKGGSPSPTMEAMFVVGKV